MNASGRKIALAGCIAFALGGCRRADLSLDPAIVSGCALGRGSIITVHWDATRAHTDFVRIYLTRPGEGERRWLQGKPVGSRKTGPWATDGITFILRESRERDLARRTRVTSPCPRKQKDE
jgi:hypothetical protein